MFSVPRVWLLCLVWALTTCFAHAQSGPISTSVALKSSAPLPSFEEFRADPPATTIGTIAPKDLSELLNNPAYNVVIMDARHAKAFDVSTLKDAKRVGFDNFGTERVWMYDRESTVVVYSALDKDSKLVAQYLKLMGFTDVQILEGGIIAWKNEGLPVYHATKGETNKVNVVKRPYLEYLRNGVGVL